MKLAGLGKQSWELSYGCCSGVILMGLCCWQKSTHRPGALKVSLAFSSPSLADEAQEAEAIRVLTCILNIRESTVDQAPQKTVFILKTLAMLYYLMMNSSKASVLVKAACVIAKLCSILPNSTGFCPELAPSLFVECSPRNQAWVTSFLQGAFPEVIGELSLGQGRKPGELWRVLQGMG